jgi:Flp pilus assembly protein TadG
MVEFALVVPMFLLLVFGLIDFSRLLFTYVSISNGAREMARVAAVSTPAGGAWSSDSAVTAFMNSTIIAAAQDGTTDKVTVRTGDRTCARVLDIGGSCSPAPASVICSMALSIASCTLSGPGLPPSRGGFIEVQVDYTFQFNPMFQNRLAGVVDVSFMRPTAQLTTTARAFVE